MSEDKAKSIIRRAEQCFSTTERSNSDSQWSVISEFVIPNQSGLFAGAGTPGAKKTRRLFDSTAVQANQDLAASIHSTLTNPSTKWSKIRFKDEALNNDRESIAWLEQVNNQIHAALNESNFDSQVSKNYSMYSSLGTMLLMHEARMDENTGAFDTFDFTAWHLAECSFSENKHGLVDTVYRKFRMTNRQAVAKFGDSLPAEVIDASITKPEDTREFYHAIFPRPPEEIKLNEVGLAAPEGRPFGSCYVDKTTGTLVREDGYYEFPVYVVRWSTLPGEVYGRGPGNIGLPDIRTLNELKQQSLVALAKAVNPPLMTNRRNIFGDLDLRPGKITVVGDTDGVRPLPSGTQWDTVQFSIEELRNSIKSIFYIDKFLLPPREKIGEMTAFETSQRLQQMQRVLGPTLSRLNSEFLTPLITRCFKMMLRERQLPEVPPALREKGINVDIVFVNQLSRSQQIDDLNNIQSWVQEMGMMAQLKPEVLDFVNVDEIAKYTAKIRGVPEVAVTNQDAVQQMREQRAQAAQAQQALESGVKAADINSKLSTGEKPSV